MRRALPLWLVCACGLAAWLAGPSGGQGPEGGSGGSSGSAPGKTAEDSARSGYTPIYGRDGEVEIWRVPTLAAEDTFGVRVKYETRTIEVQAKRLTLRDILERAREGERKRREAVTDLAYTERVRVTLLGGRTSKDKRRFFETAARVYWKPPDRNLRIDLGERQYGDQDLKESVAPEGQVQVEVSDALDFAQGPFYLEHIDDFRYSISDRRLFPDRIIYAVEFEPRSDFDPLSIAGTFWIDTADFVVVHEEMKFERNPVPLMLKSIDHIVRERQRVDGRWVITRLQLVADMRSALVIGFGRAEIEARYSDFAFNTGLSDSVFEGHR
jgi:hypothetical protein